MPLRGPGPFERGQVERGLVERRQVERWRVDRGSGPRPALQWEDALAETHAAFDVRLPEAGDFAGSVVRRRLGELSVLDCVCTPFTAERGPAVMRDAGEGFLGLQIVRAGSERAWSGRREVVLTRGDATLWDGMRPGGIEVLEPFAKRTLLLPRHVAHAVCPRLRDTDAGPVIRDSAPVRLLALYLGALIEELPVMNEATTQVAADTVLDLVRAAVEPHLPESRVARREALRARARRYVRAHLTDPDLGPVSVAAALSVSVRTLHTAFAESGESVAAFVRSARLARCREDLATGVGGTVSEIAFRWGFSEPTHFSRAFKREFGMSPRDARSNTKSRAELFESAPIPTDARSDGRSDAVNGTEPA